VNRWVSRYLTKDEVKSISDEVAKAEVQSGGEIVPMVVRACTGFSHVGILATVLSFTFFLLVFSHYEYSWSTQLNWYAVVGLGLVGSFLIGFGMANSVHARRYLTPQFEMEKRVHERAELEYYRRKVSATKEGTGVLIMISVTERKVVIFPDPSLAKRVNPLVWDEQVRILVPYLKKSQWAEGFRVVIQNVGQILAQHVPRNDKDKDELPNHLIIAE
jgi:putative membrane protein